jgi:hypothetical protein
LITSYSLSDARISSLSTTALFRLFELELQPELHHLLEIFLSFRMRLK